MTPVLRPESAARSRDRILGAVAFTLRAGTSPAADASERRNMLAFVALALGELAASVEETTQAWERRGYWVKADRFRMEWAWAGNSSREIRSALLEDDLGAAESAVGALAAHLGRAKIPARLTKTRPWENAWAQLAREGRGA